MSLVLSSLDPSATEPYVGVVPDPHNYPQSRLCSLCYVDGEPQKCDQLMQLCDYVESQYVCNICVGMSTSLIVRGLETDSSVVAIIAVYWCHFGPPL